MLRGIDALVMDESGLCPDYFGPLFARLNPRQLILFGDVNQLPPFSGFKDQVAPRSIMARLQSALEDGTPFSVPLLATQFRMHTKLCRLVSDIFYKGRLRTDPCVNVERHEFYQQTYNLQGPKWIGYAYDKDNTAETAIPHGGYINMHEINLALELVKVLRFAKSLDNGRTVSIITFYAAQMNRMLEVIYSDPAKYGDLLQLHADGQLRILTVDSAQGTEADYVFVSCVRSNLERRLGFLSSVRTGTNRICVAMSRARVAMVIFANTYTVCVKSQFQRARDMCEEVTFDTLCSEAKLVQSAAPMPQPLRLTHGPSVATSAAPAADPSPAEAQAALPVGAAAAATAPTPAAAAAAAAPAPAAAPAAAAAAAAPAPRRVGYKEVEDDFMSVVDED